MQAYAVLAQRGQNNIALRRLYVHVSELVSCRSVFIIRYPNS